MSGPAASADDLWRAVNALADRLAPDLAEGYLRTLANFRKRVSLAELRALVEADDAEELAAAIFDGPEGLMAADDLRAAFRAGWFKAGQRVADVLPAFRPPPGVPMKPGTLLRVSFDALHPSLLAAAERYEGVGVSRVLRDSRQGIVTAVTEGLFAGVHPDRTARLIRDAVGFTDTDYRWLASYRRQLETADATALERTLRDRRYDRRVAEAVAGGKPLTREEVDVRVAAYTRKLTAWRAETVSRTASLDAARIANDGLWDKAVADGQVEEATLVDEWNTRLDGRERPVHHRMHKRRKARGDRYVDAQTGQTWRYVGEGDYNCRCTGWTRPYPSAAAAARAIREGGGTPRAVPEPEAPKIPARATATPKAPKVPKAPAAKALAPRTPRGAKVPTSATALTPEEARLEAMLYKPKPKAAPAAVEPRPIQWHGDVSPAFRAKVEGTLAALPANLRRAVDATGYTIAAGDRVTTILPALKGVHPRGWGSLTWDHADGFASHRAGERLVAVAELQKDRTGGRAAGWLKSQRTEGVLRHEFGHAVDVAHPAGGPRFSHTAKFDAIYRHERNALERAARTPAPNAPPAARAEAEVAGVHKRRLAYYLQKGHAGPEEVVAEGFGILHGGGSSAHADAFRARFPRSLEALRAFLATFPP